MPSTRANCIADPVNAPVDVDDGTLCRARSPRVGIVGAFPSAVAVWDLETKLVEAARRTTPKLPAETRAEFAALLTGSNLAIFTGVLVAWAGSHFFGVGEIIDVILLVVGAFTIGLQIGQVARDLWSFVDIARNATSCDDLDLAADHLARVVVTIGITVFIALIMKAGSRLRIRTKGRSSSKTTGSARPRESRPLPPRKPPRQPSAVEDMAARPGSGTMAVASRRSLLERFYKDAGMSRAQADAHIRAADLSQPVRIVDIPPGGMGPKGNQLIQYKGPGGLGQYYTTNPNATPSSLGIAKRVKDPATGKLVQRQKSLVEIPDGHKVTGIESTAAKINDTWSIPGQTVPTQGGSGQIMIPRQSMPANITAKP